MEESLSRAQRDYVELLRLVEDDLKGDEAFQKELQKIPERERKRMLRKAARGAARDVLPVATEAILVMSANARALWNCIALRANEHAEAVIRDVYVQIAKIMEHEMPALFHGLRYKKLWDDSLAVEMPRDKL
jgi:thymidylate synthase ThyX